MAPSTPSLVSWTPAVGSSSARRRGIIAHAQLSAHGLSVRCDTPSSCGLPGSAAARPRRPRRPAAGSLRARAAGCAATLACGPEAVPQSRERRRVWGVRRSARWPGWRATVPVVIRERARPDVLDVRRVDGTGQDIRASRDRIARRRSPARALPEPAPRSCPPGRSRPSVNAADIRGLVLAADGWVGRCSKLQGPSRGGRAARADRSPHVSIDAVGAGAHVPAARQPGRPRGPDAQEPVDGFTVDFFWPTSGWSWRRTGFAITALPRRTATSSASRPKAAGLDASLHALAGRLRPAVGDQDAPQGGRPAR